MTPILAAAVLTLAVASSPGTGSIAVLPPENLSGVEAPIDAIQASLRVALHEPVSQASVSTGHAACAGATDSRAANSARAAKRRLMDATLRGGVLRGGVMRGE